jgi:hypothetical protein
MGIPKVTVSLEDVGGSFKRMCEEAPKLARQMMGTAVFTTAMKTLSAMEAAAPEGPDDEGLTPGEHIRLDLETQWTSGRPLSARVGIFDNDGQAHVALYNEYEPNQQPFMRTSLFAQESAFHAAASAALVSIERKLALG